MAGRSLILAYHNVVPDHLQGLGDRSLHLPLSRFARQLDLIEAHCRVLPLADLLAEGPFDDRPHIAITFDDAYRGAVELAMPELARRGLPSTLFVAPGLLGRQSLWWDDLASGEEGLAAELRLHALEAEEGRDDRIRARMGGHASDTGLPDSYGCASERQVHELSRSALVTLGAHSWSHPNLARIEHDALIDELTRPLAWLRATAGLALPILAYPYGLTSPAVEIAAEQAGYTAALLVEGGWFTRLSGPWRVPRYNVPAGLSEDGFLLRLAGIIGASSNSPMR
jgi:peptidoglycan/xylan/chitin deacetylase (PgdA/CDA1 family)